MRKNCWIACLWIFIPYTAYTQTTWKRTFDADSVDMVFKTIAVDDGYVMCGKTTAESFGSEDVLLLKTDREGNLLWSWIYGDSKDQSGLDIVQTTDKGFLVLGETYSVDTSGYEIFLLKTDVNGTAEWSKIYQGNKGEYAADILPVENGYLISGYTWSFSEGPDYLLMEVDDTGAVSWANYYQGGNNETCFGATITSDEHILLIGSRSVISTDNALLLKTDREGNTLWAKEYGGAGVDQCNTVVEAPNGDYLLAGSTVSFGAGLPDAYLVRTHPNGDHVWTRSYGTGSWEAAFDLKINGNGFILSGEGYAGDYYLLFLDNDGLITLERIFDNEQWERPFSVLHDPATHEVLISGFTATSEMYPKSDVYLVKTNTAGADCIEELTAPTVISTQASTVTPVDITSGVAALVVEPALFSSKEITLTETLICTAGTSGVGGESDAQPFFTIYPNPSAGELNIRLLHAGIPVKISLFNSAGQCVIQKEIELPGDKNEFGFSTMDLPGGSYNIVVESAGQQSNLSFVKL